MVSEKLTKVIDQLGYDFDQFSVTHFVAHVERYKRREIIVNALPFELDLSAMWIRAGTADYIFYNAHMHHIQQLHSILHELAHILLDHPCQTIDQALPSALLERLRTCQPQGRMRRATSRLQMDPAEQEAERLVFLIQERLVSARRMAELMGQSSSNAALRGWIRSMAFDR